MLAGTEELISTANPSTALRSSGVFSGEIHKIAVLRANAIGDFIFSLPALEALQAAYPQAELILLGLDWHAEFLRGRPGPVDRVVVIPLVRGINGGAEVEEKSPVLTRFFNKMAQEQFDLAIQLHGGGRFSNPFIQHLGARITAGARTPDASPLDLWVPYIFYQPEVLRYLEIVSLVGARPAQIEPRLFVTEQDRAEAGSLAPEGSGPLVALHPGAGDPRRQWPVEKFIAVGNSLAWAGARIVVIGTEREREIAEAVAEGINADVLNLCSRLSLGGLAGLFSRCKVVVSNDSGPLHLAGAVGAATVGIYWCGNLITAGPITTARHRALLSWRLACPDCGLDCTHFSCGHRSSFVTDVPVRDVYSAALDLLFSENQVPFLG
jgi:ADP-heptose:LPS heptosyltransferase